MDTRYKSVVKIVIIVLVCLVILVFGFQFFFPSRVSVLRGMQYELSNEVFDEEFVVTLEPSKYKVDTAGRNLIHEKIADRFDSSVYLDKIDASGENVNIYLATITHWKFLKGSCLVKVRVITGAQGITYEQVFTKPQLFDEEGKVVRYSQYGTDGGDSLIVSLKKDAFYNYEKLSIKFGGYNHLKYKLKGLSKD